MELTHQARLASARSHVRSRDLAIIAGYIVFAVVTLTAIYLAAGQPGTAAADFAGLIVLP